MANNTGQIVLIGAIGLAAVYLLTRRQTSTQLPYYPYPQQQQPQTTTQTQQLLQWAQTQPAVSTITSIINNLDWQGIADMWGKIFGGSGSSSSDYSGGGTDTPYNPYQDLDPWYYGGSGEIWV